MTSANPTIPRPPSYYFKPVRVEPEPDQQNVNISHPRPDLFEPSPKRQLRQPTPFPRPSTPPPTPFKQTPMTDRWLLDPMP
jgi:hypothetical protein